MGVAWSMPLLTRTAGPLDSLPAGSTRTERPNFGARMALTSRSFRPTVTGWGSSARTAVEQDFGGRRRSGPVAQDFGFGAIWGELGRRRGHHHWEQQRWNEAH